MPFIITYKNQSGEYTENIFFNNGKFGICAFIVSKINFRFTVNESTNAQIIDIDYKSYQIIWSCIEKNDKSESKAYYFIFIFEFCFLNIMKFNSIPLDIITKQDSYK